MPRVVGIDHLVLSVGDFARSKEFYRKLLGFLGFKLKHEYSDMAGWSNGKTLFWIAAADLDFEEAARLRDEIKRLRATELAVIDDPTAKAIAIGRSGSSSPRTRGEGPRKPTLDEMGPGPDKESKPYRPGPRSTSGRAGMRGGWRPRGR